MSEASESRRFFDQLLNRPTAEFADEIQLRERVAVWMIDWEDTWGPNATFRDVGSTGNASKACGRTSILDIGGTFATDARGTAEFLLSDFYCNEWFSFGHGTLTFEYPIVFVATPQTNAPIFLTSLQGVVAHETPIPGPVNDIKFTVFSWDTNGSPRGNVLFDWRCSVGMSWDSIFDKPRS